MSPADRRQLPLISIVSLAVGGVAVAWFVQSKKQSSDSKASTGDRSLEEEKKSDDDLSDQLNDPPIKEIGGGVSMVEDEGRDRVLVPNTITIAHGSVTGTCAKLANSLQAELQKITDKSIQVGKLEEWDWWDELLNEDDGEIVAQDSSSYPVLLIIIPTHHAGSWPSTSTCLQTALNDLKSDWRIQKYPLKKVRVGILGMGCSDYDDDTMGMPAKEAFKLFRSLGATTFGQKVRVGDDAVGNEERVFQSWLHHDILPLFVSHEEDQEDDEDDKEPTIIDLEDMGTSIERGAKEEKEEDEDGAVGIKGPAEVREMVTKSQAVSLKKEGYKLIGTHSAVKLCRWTKHQLRGRGGCYKHTFYGITSYQCMETTPSLACANKCVFCWRHHKNPVAKEWKWKTDDPYFIVDEAVKMHVHMIKEAKGIPGVNMQRWKEAHTVKHCALSLVGEPIMYPRINELLSDLHTRDISTFLVTNGQHPKYIDTLVPVTQLYVSVDAPTPESLIAIDRPLFSDAWERLQQSLVLLKDKGQRTVARLTVVKGWNSDEVSGYAKLIALGKVSLVEVKGVTFCGKSDASNLNMSNTPWHHEVIDLVKQLKIELDKLRELGGPDAPPEYDFACEHRHSVSVLLARVDQFTETAEDGSRIWKTWINYPKFQEFAAKHAADPTFTFDVKDYAEVTPSWALFGATEEGFDPTETRHRRQGKHPKYAKFDERGVPTHDDESKELSAQERTRLNALMDQRIKQVGLGSTTTALKGGEIVVQDASLMFRGKTVVK